MNLVIVESPTKGRTIEKYLGKDYKVLASFGHVRDLPASKIGIDVEHDFTPDYKIIPKAKKNVDLLKKEAAKADNVYLATDYDREGEAIAWHLAHVLGLHDKKKPVQRITYHEITKDAIMDAIKHPRELDMYLIDAQQARRILDRLVGYKLSPFLWKKVMSGLSAGRVQSVAVRLIVDREREILAFVPVEYWSVEADLAKSVLAGEQFTANLVSKNGEKLDKLAIFSETMATETETALTSASYRVVSMETTDQQKWPSAPFTTSTLQQEASRKLGYSAKRTMKLAQNLYEAGQITYMRTDSTNLANEAVAATRQFIESSYGSNYLPASSKMYKTKAKGAQEAHEAIRPTQVTERPETVDAESDDHRRLYDLIWRRLVACQMQPAILAQTKVLVNAATASDQYGFSATGTSVKFDGYLRVWPTKMEERTLPTLVANDDLDLKDLRKDQHFTEPPARFNEASLIKALEEHGIGRPATYASTISTIEDRGYVRVENRVFFPQEIGMVVTDLLKEHFPDVVNIGFTAQMEEDLDKIAEGEANWVKVLQGFYTPFAKNLANKLETVVKKELVTETTDEICDKCGQPMKVKLGRFGKFLACSGFPDCKNTKPLNVSTGVSCPVCGTGELVERKTRRGKTFWSCNRYPDCRAATWDLNVPAEVKEFKKKEWGKKSSKVKTQKAKRKTTTKKSKT